MRGALQKIDGVSGIEPDVMSRICTFKLSNDDIDLTSTLDVLAKTNPHLSGWSFVDAPE